MADAVVIKIDGDAKGFHSSLAGIAPAAQSAIGGMSGSVLKGIASWSMLKAGVTSAVSAIKNVLDIGKSFESAMSEVQAISGATADELERLEKAARAAGENTAFSASEAAGALKYMALAGWDAEKSIAALDGVLALAGASGMDLQAASDSVTDYMSAFGWSADRAGEFADMMVYANNRANTSASDLAAAYGNSASYMTTMGQTAQQTTAALMALANQGVKGAEAGTKLSAIYRDISQKMVNGQIKIGKSMVDVVDTTTGEFLDFSVVLGNIESALNGLSEVDRANALGETFSAARSIPALSALLSEGSAKITEYANGINDAAGIATDAYNTMQDNLKGDQAVFNSAMEEMKLVAYDSFEGIAREGTQIGTSIVQSISAAGRTGGIEGMFKSLVNQFSAIAPKLIAEGLKILKSVSSALIKGLPTLFKGLFASLPDLVSDLGGMIPEITNALASTFGEIFAGLITAIPKLIPALVDAIGNVVTGLSDSFARMFDTLWDKLFNQNRLMSDFQSMGSINFDAELTYDLTEDGESRQSAIEKADAAKSAFVTELKGYGLTTEDVVKILAFEGTSSEIFSMLSANYPNLTMIQKAAIAAKFIGVNIYDELKSYNLKDTDIEKVLKWQENGDTAAIEAYLSDNYPDMKRLVMNALEMNFNNSTHSIGTNDNSMNFVLELMKDMFTNGKKEDPEAVAAIAEMVNSQIEQYKKAFQQALDNGLIDQTEYDKMLSTLNMLGGSLDTFVSGYSGMATADCEQAVSDMMALSSTVEEVFNNLQEKQSILDSLEARLFNAGAMGAKLSTEDTLEAFQYIGNKRNSELASLKEQRDAELMALDQSADDYATRVDEINKKYEALADKVKGNASIDLADLLLGQLTANGVDSAKFLPMLLSIQDEITALIEDNKFSEETLRAALEAAGYSADTIDAALASMFSVSGRSVKDGFDPSILADLNSYLPSMLRSLLEGMDLKDVTPEIVADFMRNNGFNDDNLISQVIEKMFDPESTHIEIPDAASFEALLGGVDFSSIGAILKTAIENGLMEAPEGWEGMSLSELVFAALKAGSGDKEPINVDDLIPDVKADNVEVDADATVNVDNAEPAEDVDDKLADAVEDGKPNKPVDVETKANVDVVSAEATEGSGDVIAQAAADASTTVDVNQSANVSATVTATVDVSGAQSTAFTQGQAVGRFIVMGIETGISNRAAAAKSRAVALATEIANAIKGALKINSPSKVMIPVGSSIAEGLEVGMERYTPTLLRSAAGMARSAISAVEGSAGMMNYGSSYGFSGLTDSVNALNETVSEGNTYTFNIDGKKIAEATVEDNNTALNSYSQRVAMGYGRG